MERWKTESPTRNRKGIDVDTILMRSPASPSARFSPRKRDDRSPSRKRATSPLLDYQWNEVDRLENELCHMKSLYEDEKLRRMTSEEEAIRLKEKLYSNSLQNNPISTTTYAAEEAYRRESISLKTEISRLKSKLEYTTSEYQNKTRRLERQLNVYHKQLSSEASGFPKKESGPPTDVLIGTIREAFLEADKKGGVAEEVASKLKKTESKILLLTQENQRIQNKLERSQRRTDDLKRQLSAAELALKDTQVDQILIQSKSEELHSVQITVESLQERISTLEVENKQLHQINTSEKESLKIDSNRLVNNLKRENDQQEITIKKLNKQLTSAADATSALQKTNSQLLAQHETCQADNSRLMVENNTINQKIRINNDTAGEVDALKQNIRRTENDIIEKDRKILQLQDTVSDQTNTVNQLQQQLKETVDDRYGERSRLLEQISSSETALKYKTETLTRDREVLTSKVDDLQQIITTLRPRVEILTTEKTTAMELKIEEERKVSELKQTIHRIESSSLEKEREVYQLRGKLSNFESKQTSIVTDAEYASREATLRVLEKDVDAKNNELLRLRESHAEAIKSSERYRIDYEKESSKYHREIELIKLSKSQELELTSSKLHHEIETLKSTLDLTERRREMLETEIGTLKTDNIRLSEQHKSITEHYQQSKEQARRNQQQLVTSENQHANDRTTQEQNNRITQDLREELSVLKHKLQHKETEATELLKGLQQQTEATTTANNKRNEVEADLREVELQHKKESTKHDILDSQRHSELEEVKKRNKLLQEQLFTAQAGIEQMQSDYQNLKDTMDDIMQERRNEHTTVIQPLEKKVEKLKSELSLATERCKILEKQLDAQQTRGNDLNAEMTNTRIASAEYKVGREESMRRLTEATDQLKSSSQQNQKLEIEVHDLIVEKQSLTEKLQSISSTAYDEQLTLNAAVQEANRERLTFRTRYDNLDSENKRLATDRESLDGNLKLSEERVSTLTLQMKTLQRQLSETERELLSLKSKNQNLTDDLRVLRDTKNRLSSLEINHAALTEKHMSSSTELSTLVESNHRLTTEKDILKQQLRDKSDEATDLKNSLEMMRRTGEQYTKEAVSIIQERASSLEAAKESVEMEEVIFRLKQQIADDEVLIKNLRAESEKLKILLEDKGADLEIQKTKVSEVTSQYKHSQQTSSETADELQSKTNLLAEKLQTVTALHHASVNLQLTTLTKLSEYVQEARQNQQDSQTVISPSARSLDDTVTKIQAAGKLWSSDPLLWDPPTAETLFMSILNIVMRSLSSVRHSSVKSHHSQSPSQTDNR